MKPVAYAAFALVLAFLVGVVTPADAPSASSGGIGSAGELIDQFQNISQEGVGFSSMATAGGFAALDGTPRFDGGVIGTPPPKVPKAFAGVVALGVQGLPSLLAHLDDDRPTKLIIHHDGGFGAMWTSTEIDVHPYDRVSSRSDLGLDPNPDKNDFDKWIKTYTLKVGDVCFAAIGQIVNRAYNPIRYQMTACIVINSPVESPELCKAIRTEWHGLTVKDHQRSLIMDSKAGERYAQADAGVRLLYYYPKLGKNIVVEMLRHSSTSVADVYNTSQLIDSLHWNHDADIDNTVDSVLVHISKTLENLVAKPLSDKNENQAFEIETCGISCINHLIDRGHADHCRTFRDLSLRWLTRLPAGYAKEQYLASFKEISKHLDIAKTHAHP